MTQTRRTLCCLGVLLCTLAACDRPDPTSTAAPEAPPLTGETPRCERLDGPGVRGRQARAAAGGRVERYPFAPREGLRALELLAEARACFEQADDEEQARGTAALHAALLQRLDADYRALRIRLSRALAADRREQALRASRRLLALLDGRDGAYVSYLRTLEHALARRAVTEEDK